MEDSLDSDQTLETDKEMRLLRWQEMQTVIRSGIIGLALALLIIISHHFHHLKV